MLSVTVSTDICASGDAIWEIVGDFGNLARWLPAITSMRCTGSAPGSERSFTVGGQLIRERLLRRDERTRSLTYRLLDGPLPVDRYESTLTVESIDTAVSNITWFTTCDAVGIDPERCKRLLQRVYFDALDQLAVALTQPRNAPESRSGAV